MDFSQFDKESLIEYAEQNGVKVDKRWSVERIAKAIEGAEAKVSDAVMAQKDTLSTVVVVDDVLLGVQAIGIDKQDAMNTYALRIWEGQSPDLPLRERVTRINAALERQGFTDLATLSLPIKEDIKRYL